VLCSVSCEYPSGTNINAERWPQSRRKPNGRSLACALGVCAYARNGVQRAPVTRRTTNVRPPAGTRWPTSPTLLHGALVVRSPSGDKGTHFGHKGYVLSRAATAYRCVYHSRVRPRSSVVRQLCNRSHDRRLLTASLPSRSAPLSDAAPLARLCAVGHCDGLPPAVLFPVSYGWPYDATVPAKQSSPARPPVPRERCASLAKGSPGADVRESRRRRLCPAARGCALDAAARLGAAMPASSSRKICTRASHRASAETTGRYSRDGARQPRDDGRHGSPTLPAVTDATACPAPYGGLFPAVA
jgi:hypothetical protein